MIVHMIICDVCNEEIPKVRKKDPLGNEREYYRLGKIEVDNFCIQPERYVNFHVCERCAGKLSVNLMKWKIDTLIEIQTSRPKKTFEEIVEL